MVLDGVWSVLDCVGCWSVQTNPKPSNNVGFQYQVRNCCVFLITRTKMLDDVGWKVWTKSNSIQRCPKLSNMFDRTVQTGQTCCIQQWWIMFDQHVWSVWTGLNNTKNNNINNNLAFRITFAYRHTDLSSGQFNMRSYILSVRENILNMNSIALGMY